MENLENKSFKDDVLELSSKIPKGKVTTYKEIARQLNTKAYRAVGTALSKNKEPKKYFCHRVVESSGDVGGYAFGGKRGKIKMLKKEGINIQNCRVKDMEKFLYKF